MYKLKMQWLFALAGMVLACSASAQSTYSDNFSGNKASLEWIALGDACLTAGKQTGTSSQNNPIIPACSTKNFAYPDDGDDKGALLLTPAKNSQSGAILSNFTFPMSQGLEVTFTTYSFGSTSNGAPAHIGADGITFFLTDGTKSAPPDTGATGGAMGYSCSFTNTGSGKKWNGIEHGYLGLGMDEWGNFLNNGDNSGDGVLNTNVSGAPSGHGGNAWQNGLGAPGDSSGKNYQPNRIGMRGAGNVNFKWLHQQNPAYYKKNHSKRVAYACHNGKYLASGTNDGKNGHWEHLKYDYYAIPGAYKALPESQPLANVKASNRYDDDASDGSSVAWPVTYKVTISSSGMLNFSYSYNNGDFQPVLTNTNIANINGIPPDKFRFGFSAGTGGQNNVHEITCFKASPLLANSSAGSNTVTGKVTGSTQFFFASYSSDSWWGSLVADKLVTKDDGDLAIGTIANWDAKCVLTGGKCASTGDTAKVQSPSSRTLLTWDNDAGVDLKWADLGSDAQEALNQDMSGNEDDKGETRVEWLRGVRSVEQLQSPPGDLRARQSVLGDIINSSPTFVGAPTSGALPDGFYDLLHTDQTLPENGDDAEKYSAFVADNAERENVVYAGSNDGFLHGFRAGKYASGIFDSDTNDGREILGFMPHDVLLGKAVNLTDPLYQHDYLVDATPVAGDVFYDNAWHTWLAGGVGSDGKEIYALDITKPSNFGSADASSLVIGDWDSSTLPHLGNTVGTPIIKRMHNGDWAIIFGTGLHKDNDGTVNNDSTAGIYIGLIDPATGDVTFHFLDTDTGSSASPDGIAYVSSADLDGDYIADYLYAGDTQGNVWRFDVTSANPSDWKASTFGHDAATPLFVAKDGSGNLQPITTSITILSVKTSNVNRVMLYFGTGQETPSTADNGTQYATGTQTFYGIWDWNMDAWNDMATAYDDYAELSDTHSITRDTLLKQTVVTLTAGSTDGDVKGYRTLSTKNVVCWKGSTNANCADNDQYGWMFDLPGQGPDTGANKGANEQIIYSPAYIDGAVVVNTAIPPVISAFQCNPGLQSGWTMAFNPATGGGMETGYFADASGSFNGGDATVGGVKANGVGTPTTVTYHGSTYLVTQTITGGGLLLPTKGGSNDSPARVSWRELVNP